MTKLRRATATDSALPVEIEEALAGAMLPIEPSRERASALRERVLGRARADRQGFVTVRTADGSWEPLAPSVAIKMLDDDGAMQAFLLRLDAGARLPAHEHTGDEVCLVLEGSVRLGDVDVSAGDYHVALGGSRHGDIVSMTGALLFIRTPSGSIPPRATR